MKSLIVVNLLLLMVLNPLLSSAVVPDSSVYQGQIIRQSPSYQHNQYNPAENLQGILSRLKAANNVSPQEATGVVIDNTATLNASTNGRKILVTRSLLALLHTNDERAFVIAHELSHIILNHVARTQFRHEGLSILDSLLADRYGGTLVQLAGELGIGMVDKRSSRSFEYQADDLGIQLMTKAGYNPRAALRVFQALNAATPPNHVPEFLQDHPITDDRIKALVNKYGLTP